MDQIIHIKNMVCPRCVMVVQSILSELKISYSSIELGEVKVNKELNPKEKLDINSALKKVGFELIEAEVNILIAKIKALIINQIYYSDLNLKINYSEFIEKNIGRDYGKLSRIFSENEKITIEKFIAKQKIEKVKELLFNNEKTLSEIAFDLNYSSSAYLSTQFKKETGMTPTEFKLNKMPRKTIDSVS